ncbi:MAG: SdiA-regulated domain-containing protein [Chthoniobacter sp.]
MLCQEASSVTYDWDTDTLFVVGDGGTSVVQVSKTGQLINSMTLATGSSPQGTEFYDTEGITYVGGGQFVFTEERYRQANLFTYVAGGTLQRSATRTVKLGTTIGNIGLEGVSYDPQTSGFLFVKEKDPESIFQTGIDFNALTATNGSPTATGSTDLFNPALANTLDFSDVFALSNLPALAGKPTSSHLLIISQESGRIVHLDRNGTIYSSLTIVADPGNPLSVPDQTHEGVTMDRSGFLYTVLRKRRRRQQSPPALGLCALHRHEPGAHRSHPQQRGHLHPGEYQHGRAREGRGYPRARRWPRHE